MLANTFKKKVSIDTFNKFDDSGNPKPYYGNTIISFLNNESWEVYRYAVAFQNELKKTSYAQKLAFLPPDSFHMTVLNLCRVVDKGQPTWPDMIPEEVKFSEVDKKIKSIVDSVPVPENIWMKVNNCHKVDVELVPADEESLKKIQMYRAEVADKTTIRHPWHDTFKFHISLSYCVDALNAEEEAENKILCEKYTEILTKSVTPFLLPKPEFSIFNDMMSYYTDLGMRGDKF